jgi:RNA methyltransferase, TrmH family
VLSDANARLAAARRLTSRKGRREAGRFLAEGAQSVREALVAGAVVEVFATAEALDRHPDRLAPRGDRAEGVSWSEISPRAAAELSETVHPQGLIAVCRTIEVTVGEAFARGPGLVAGLVEANDPGNAGTILRTADAAGAGAVVFTGSGVDVYNGKAVRASAGSLFHLDVATAAEPDALVQAARAAGLQVLATTGAGEVDLDEIIDDGSLVGPTLWLFGNEAHGLPSQVLAAADLRVRVPIHGRAESLNLSAAAAVCLYASARARRGQPGENVVARALRHARDASEPGPREIGSPN